MVSSEQLFEYIKEKATMKISRDRDGEVEFAEPVLSGKDLSAALRVVGHVIEVEASAAAAQQHLELHRTPSGGGVGGHGNYN